MKQQELKDIKRTLTKIYEEVAFKANDPSRPPGDEDSEYILRGLHALIATIGTRIELKYKKEDNG